MKLSDKKKLFWSILDPIMQEKGYTPFKTGGDPSYVSIEEYLVKIFVFNFPNLGNIEAGGVCLSLPHVENYILSIGVPNKDMDVYLKNKRYFLYTVIHRTPGLSFKEYYEKIGVDYAQNSYQQTQETEEEVIRHAHAFLYYLNHEGAAFIEHYGYLPNILKEMDRLEAEGEDWNGILSGYGDRLFRGIIISKLCNDSNYEKKLSYCDQKFTTVELLKDWQPYWEKLKALLPAIEPKYPYYK